jgi:hypothetical protein
VLIKHADFLLSFVMEGIFVENAIQRSNIVVVGIPKWEVAASDIDVRKLLSVATLHDGKRV